jgi:hypothetical protein
MHSSTEVIYTDTNKRERFITFFSMAKRWSMITVEEFLFW